VIVKCQRSITTTEDVPQMLFYNRARDWVWQGDLTAEWDGQFGPSPKTIGEQMKSERFFAEVRWRDRHQPPEFVRRVGEQNW
jgi:hypothetical protein